MYHGRLSGFGISNIGLPLTNGWEVASIQQAEAVSRGFASNEPNLRVRIALNMSNQITKFDPIRKKFFTPLERAEKLSGLLFITVVALTIFATLFDEVSYKRLNGFLQWSLVVTVVLFFILDQSIRLYFAPRAQDSRAQDFLSQAYRAPLSGQQTAGYYNNSQTDPARRIAAQVFENTLFTREVSGAMLKVTGAIAALYFTLWFAGLASRDVPLPLVATCAQVVFGEQLLARCFRLFWLHRRSDNIFNDMHRLFLAKPNSMTFSAMALESFTKYEAAKAIAGITLSSRIFERLNPKLSAEWVALRKTLGV